MNVEARTSTSNNIPASDVKSPGLRAAANIAFASVCGLAFGFTVWVLVLSTVSPDIAGKRDFVSYWANGQLLVRHMNPYDGAALGQLERAAGFAPNLGVMYMLSPPWTLPVLYPLGFLSIQIASIVWAILEAACFAISIYLLWSMHGRPRSSRHYLGYTFAPALICLMMGQLTIFALLGLVLFLRFHRTHPFTAGASLWLCSLKFHLFLPFGVVLLAWIVIARRFRILFGASAALAASIVIALPLVGNEWAQYLNVLRHPGDRYELVPCLSVLFRVWINRDAAWLAYVPAAVGCGWALWYFWMRRRTWDWMKDGSLLILVSIVVAPHTYLYDQVLAIPALLQGAYATRSRNLLVALALLSVLVEAALFAIVWKPSALYYWTLWSAPAWAIWYLMATARTNAQASGSTNAQFDTATVS